MDSEVEELKNTLSDCRQRLRQAQSLDTEASSRLQTAVLIHADASGCDGLEWAYAAMPSRMVDGDFLDISKIALGTVDVLLGDVMGKGMEAAIHGTVIKFAVLKALACLALHTREIPDLSRLMEEAQKKLGRYFIGRRSIATLVYARFDQSRQLAEFVDCGHTGIVHYRAGKKDCRLVKGADMPLGFVESQSFRPFLLPYDPGDFFILFSDGLSECSGSEGELFGEERLMRIAKAHAGASPRELVDAIVRLGFEFSASGFTDDMTIVCMRCESGTDTFAKNELALDMGKDKRPPTEILREAIRSDLEPRYPEDFCSAILLACHEALENIAEHGQLQEDTICTVRWGHRPGYLYVEFSYHGADYDWLIPGRGSVDSYDARGYGKGIILKAMDSVLLTTGLGSEKSLVLCRRLP